MNNDFEREDVLALVPIMAQRVLDVGCGTGRLGRAIKARQECTVTGVEPDKAAGRVAGENLDSVQVTTFERFMKRAADGEAYDCIIMADVLEHMDDPLQALRDAHYLLAEDCAIVGSVPNARNWQMILRLVEGDCTYEPQGLFDYGHKRLFSRYAIEQLLDAAGFAMCESVPVYGAGAQEWQEAGQPAWARHGRLEVRDLSPGEAMDLYTYQWLFRAYKRPLLSPPVTNIVIPVLNQAQMTAACIMSIEKHTPEAHVITLVDNGSTEDMSALCGLADGITYIRNDENYGFARACNQGMAAWPTYAQCLLNNDTIVTPGWLRRMHECLQREERVGLVGPRTNCASGPQQMRVGYRSMAELDGWAWEYSKRRRGEAYPFERLVGFCLLVAPHLYAEIGGFDEDFGIGTYEDDDYCVRAAAAGYKAYIANDAFVHHHGNRTFQAEGIDMMALMRENGQKYLAKHSNVV